MQLYNVRGMNAQEAMNWSDGLALVAREQCVHDEDPTITKATVDERIKKFGKASWSKGENVSVGGNNRTALTIFLSFFWSRENITKMTSFYHRELGSFTCQISGNGSYTTINYADWFYTNDEAGTLIDCLAASDDQQYDCDNHHMETE